ncbi:MAG: c-type cytochrome [Candidatus Poribacteria bacterium]
MTRHRIAFTAGLLGIAGAAILALTPVGAHAQAPTTDAGTTEHGRALYKQECETCHGIVGKGDGPASYLLFPKPRDFTKGAFKVRTTATGQLPTDADLQRTLELGFPGSGMPNFAHVSKADRAELIDVVKSFLPKSRRQTDEVVTPPPPSSSTDALVEQGAQVYTMMGCDRCHGPEGRADGPASATLRDEWGNAIRANDFTRGIYKGGATDEDVYLRFITGMMGTPMPSYGGIMTDEQAYALVHYVKSLAGDVEPAVQPKQETLTAVRVSGAVPEDPGDAVWVDAPESNLPVMLLHQRQDVIRGLRVKAAHNGVDVAICLEWDDAEPNASMLRHEDFSDAVAVQFALGSDTTIETLTMGIAQSPINIWHWQAARQMDVVRFRDVETAYPGMVADDYPWSGTAYPNRPDSGAASSIAVPSDYDNTFLTALAAGNPVSRPVGVRAVHELNAAGFGSLTSQPETAQSLRGVGVWDSGVWKVVVVRHMKSTDRRDAHFQEGAPSRWRSPSGTGRMVTATARRQSRTGTR